MYIKLFDVENEVVIPTAHCYTLKFLKDIKETYPSMYLKVFAYLQYMTSWNPEDNPYLMVSEEDKEEAILNDIGAQFSTEDDVIQIALKKCKAMLDVPSHKSWVASKSALEKLNRYLESAEVTTGKDGSGDFIIKTMEKLPALNSACNQIFKDFQEEAKMRVRGDKFDSQV